MSAESLAGGQAQFAAQQAEQARSAAQSGPGGPKGGEDLLEAARQGKMSREEIRDVAQKYEGFFVGKMLNLMFETVPENKLFGGGPGEKHFEELMVNQYGKEVAKKGGFGVGNQMAEQLLQAQEGKI